MRLAAGALVNRKPTESLSSTRPVRARKLRDVEAFGADQPGFFADREDDIDVAAGQAVFFDNPQDFADDRDAAFVVAAEHGACRRCAEYRRRGSARCLRRAPPCPCERKAAAAGSPARCREIGDQIADVAADFFTGVIDGNRRAKFFHLALKAHGDVIFLAATDCRS